LGKPKDYDKLERAEQERLKGMKDLLPSLKFREKGKTADELFKSATEEVRETYHQGKMKGHDKDLEKTDGRACKSRMIKSGYNEIAKEYDKHTLRSFLEKDAKWSESAINLYNWSNAHVVFENSFIESLKDAFLSSNAKG
jgi:hypothetical protein